MSEMAEAIRQLIQEKGYSEDSVRQIIEKALKAAYKKTYGTDENAVVQFNEDMSDVSIYSKKVVIDGVYDPVREIELEEAREKYSEDIEEGMEILILEDPKSFDRGAVATGKQSAHQSLNEDYKKTLMNEYKDKVGEVIIGYYQREKNGNIFVDLGNAGKVEGFLPLKYQSKLEYYEKDSRIRALIVEVQPTSTGIQLVLSRSDPKLVEQLLETEVPEIADGTVEVVKTVRDAGYRTKFAVTTKSEGIDPVGACVGLKGSRIQNVIRALEGEKIDVLKWDPDPSVFIKNALSPAQVQKVLIMDADKRQALAIVEESQFSLAIGKQGQNVRLANKLCDWNIDVKTVEQAAEMDLSQFNTIQTAQNLFNNDGVEDQVIENNEESEDITTIAQLPGVSAEVADALKAAGIEGIEDFVDAYDGGNMSVEGISAEEIEAVNTIIHDNFEFVTEDEEAADETEETAEEYTCPECGAPITVDMTKCPNCGIELSFEEVEE
ncbi:MAG: transcription termination factor NusA [Treponema sp.]|nr:transcription termination factor NusA [Treponema sp.]